MESLELRALLSGAGEAAPTWRPTTTDLRDAQNGPLALAGQQLITTYFNYESYIATGKTVGFGPGDNGALGNLLVIQNSFVDVDIRGFGDFNAFRAQLSAAGMKIGTVDANLQMVEGAIPIGSLPQFASLPQLVNIVPVFRPTTHATAVLPPVSGIAPNQADQVLQANVARQQYGVNGAGVTVGVISNSANRFAGGLADSIRTGDLPSSVRILNDATGTPADGSPGGNDEGRAMLEQIHDIAPGANLLFSSGAPNGNSPLTFPDAGELYFASSIRNLASAGSKVIVDDLGYGSEPFYQDGPVAQAVTDVTNASGVSFFSAAGNAANSGYQSQFRGVAATVPGAGTGRFMNFNPNGGTPATTLRVTVTTDTPVVFQYDQPFYTNNGVNSDVRIFFVNTTTGRDVALDTTNKIAQKAPLALLTIPAGTYDVSIQVKTGGDVGHVVFLSPSGQSLIVDQSYGNNGGTFYPTTFGHPTAAAAIGIGAVPWFDATPFNVPAGGVKSETFSSYGPAIKVFNPDGSRLPVPLILQKPDVSAPDGNDTTFFPPGQLLQTVNPPPGTGPATPTELDNDRFPNFFGTSSAAPNLAAVGALMKQLNPAATPGDVKNALIASAAPLNSQAPGSFNPQAGFGLVQAPAALNAVSRLTVASATPAAGSIATSAPTSIDITFNKPVDFNSLQPGSLVFTNKPPGATVVVGTPILISPTVVRFPISFVSDNPNTPLNGNYSFLLVGGSITSTDGMPLVIYGESFQLQDTTSPRIVSTIELGRIVVLEFSKALRQSTVNKDNIVLIRTGATGVLGTGTNLNVLNDPRASIYYYFDTTSNTAKVVLDLRTLDQSQLPSDHYYIGVNDSVTDAVGNRLDGEFSGFFPSGNNVAGGGFVQDLGVLILSPPIVTTLSIAASSDTGLPNDQNTRTTRPVFYGVVRNPFPGTTAGLQVAIQFSGPRGNSDDLSPGLGGRGFVGTPDLLLTTDANGAFIFQAPFDLPDGLQSVRAVVVGGQDVPPQPGLSSVFDAGFRIDTSNPTIVSSVPASGSPITQLTSLSLNVADPVNPVQLGNPLGVPTGLSFPALDPATASNISNYQLFNLGPNRTRDAQSVNLSSFITSATFVPTTNRAQTGDPFTGRIDLTFAPGLPAGLYALYALGVDPATGKPGITDAAGNLLDADLATPGIQNYFTLLDLQPTAPYLTSYQAVGLDAKGSPVVTQPKAFYEIPSPGASARANAPPTSFNLDFSTPLNTLTISNDTVQLLFSPDGAFDGVGANVTRIRGTAVQLTSSDPSTTNTAQPGYQNRLILRLPAGTTLAAGHYRLYIPNNAGNKLLDIYGAWLDGEFLGNPTATGGYENLLPNGQYRAGLSGDGTPGGSFESGFLVVPSGNVIYARPDYIDQRFNTADDPDGSLSKPYPTLAPQATATSANGGDLNAFSNFANYDPNQDRAQAGAFQRSAFYAAQVASANGPVVIVALPSLTGGKTFVLDLPPRTDPNRPGQVLDGSASVPFNTTLAFLPGSTLRLFNAALFAQNQGSAIQLLGTAANPVTFTSFFDPNFNPSSPTAPQGGDWGGIVYRNFDQGGMAVTTGGTTTYTTRPDLFPVDGQLKGTGTSVARVGADEALSIINFATLRYGGGSVPQTQATGFDVVQALNSRPTVVNTRIADSFNPLRATGAQGAIGADFDSFREDDLSRGPLLRRDVFVNNSINGVLLRAQPNGAVQETNAVLYPDNDLTRGGARNFVFNSPVPFVLASRFELGNMFMQDSGSQSVPASNRTYFQPGSLFKFERGAGLDVFDAIDPLTGLVVDPLGRHTSVIIGDRSYIKQFDQDPFFGPMNLNGTVNTAFQPNSNGDAPVLFTSFFDDNATTRFKDPVTGVFTTIVAPNDTDNGGPVFLPTPGNVPDNARWGSVSVRSGAVANIDETTFQFGGGSVNTPGGTVSQRAVLDFQGASAVVNRTLNRVVGGTGTHVSITNNNFYDNLNVPMNINPNGLLAADPLRPLISGKPFFRGNVMQRNTFNGLGVDGGELDVNSVWDSSDLTYFLRGTVYLTGDLTGPAGTQPRLPSATTLLPEITPNTTLTIQSRVPDTLLADGSHIARPGESTIVKLLGAGPTMDFALSQDNPFSSTVGGAGFIVGADTNHLYVDPGFNSQIRILGVGGNESLNQARVPVIITSAYDNSVGTTVRGVTMFQLQTDTPPAPSAGDGGILYFGANSLYTYNLFDLREGNRIDNADLRYMSRVEMQSSGLFDSVTGNDVQDFQGDTFLTQNNAKKANAISNTNISNFRDLGIYEHAGFNAQPILISSLGGVVSSLGVATRRGARVGEGIVLFLVNSTISNTPIGVQVNGPYFPGSVGATDAVLLHNTFFNDATAIRQDNRQAPTPLPFANADILAMDNIISGAVTASFINVGGGGQYLSQYNDIYNSAPPVGSPSGVDNQPTPPITGNPLFRNPAAGNFNLTEKANGVPSAAIDAARSELGPSFFGGLLTPISNQRVIAGTSTLAPGGISDRNVTNRNGNDFVALPGLVGRNFKDQFQAVLVGSPGSVSGPASNVATYSYVPTVGQRDQSGFLRQDDPGVPNVGFGSQPFFDIGAFEFRQLFPPHVISVVATTAANPSGTSIYAAGGISGSNRTPDTIRIQFNNLIDPTTINAMSVLLQASGGDGIFGNNNSPSDKFINLSGKLSFDNTTNSLVISLGASGLTLSSDEYRIILEGNGANVLRDPQGNALDGENLDLANTNPNTNQLPLPSGDGVPGGNFQVTFTIDTNPPAVLPGVFGLTRASDSNRPDLITNINRPSFQGTITDIFPPSNFLQGQTVILDISTRGDGVFDIPNDGTAITDAAGNFVVTSLLPLPDSLINAGPDGLVGTADDGGYSLARVRIIDQAGNASNPNDPNALATFAIDTSRPIITSSQPAANSVVTALNGRVRVTFAVNKTLDLSTLTSATITAIRSGGDGIFGPGGTAADVPLTIDPASISAVPLRTAKGAEVISFDVLTTAVNDTYRITLGPGITDIAGNPIVGNDATGTNFVIGFLVFDTANTSIIYVAPATTIPPTPPNGTRQSPFSTIGAGLAAAKIGDTVAVLPGVYNETAVLKAQVRLVSAAPASTATRVVPGNALQTIIRPNPTLSGSPTYSVIADSLNGIAGIPTEIAGFTIASPLGGGDPARGPIVQESTGIAINNSAVTVDRNYLIDNYRGVFDTEGAGSQHSQFLNNVFAGNTFGLVYVMPDPSVSVTNTSNVTNNDFAFNLFGLYDIGLPRSSPMLNVFNNIFWQNDRTSVRGGSGIASQYPNQMVVAGNMFSSNGASQASPADDALNVGGGFDPAILSGTPDAGGNFVGVPAFVAPRDPRGPYDGPAVFFREANFDLTASSAAIDSALNSLAPTVDLLNRGRIRVPGRGVPFGGPADVGAFEYHPASGGIPVTSAAALSNAFSPQAVDQVVAAGLNVASPAAVTTRDAATPPPASAATPAPAPAPAPAPTPAPAPAPVTVTTARTVVPVTPPPAVAPATVHGRSGQNNPLAAANAKPSRFRKLLGGKHHRKG